MSVCSTQTGVPRIVTTLLGHTHAVVTPAGTDRTVMDINVMVGCWSRAGGEWHLHAMLHFQTGTNVWKEHMSVFRIAITSLAPTTAVAMLGTYSVLMGVAAMVGWAARPLSWLYDFLIRRCWWVCTGYSPVLQPYLPQHCGIFHLYLWSWVSTQKFSRQSVQWLAWVLAHTIWNGSIVDVDIDECAEAIPYCEQNCSNTEGSYTCGCQDGYLLNTDGRRCDGGVLAYKNRSLLR